MNFKLSRIGLFMRIAIASIFLLLNVPLVSRDSRLIELTETIPISFPEPSGICYYPPNNSLFLVGDEGHLAEISPEGEILQMVLLGDLDLEGISYDPWSGLLAAVAEKRNLLILIDPESLRIKRTIPVPSPKDGSYEGVAVIAPGSVALVNQARGKKDKKGILILENLYTDKLIGKPAVKERFLETGIVDQSDIFFHRTRECYYILSDNKNTLYHYSLDGKRLGKYRIPGENQEGVTFGPDERIYITQDSGGIFILESQK